MKQPYKNGYLPINIVWTYLWVTLWASMKCVIPVTTLPKIEAPKMTVSLYMKKSHTYEQ